MKNQNMKARIEHNVSNIDLIRKIASLALINEDLFEQLAEGIVDALVYSIWFMTRIMVK